MQTSSPPVNRPRTTAPEQERPPIRVVMLASWSIGAALVFLVFLLVGIQDRTALPLVGILAAALSAEIVTGTTCVLKGYPGVGWAALTAWLAFPIGSAISSAMFPETREPALLGSALGTGVIMVVAALSAITAVRPARWGSRWERAGWGGRPGRSR